MKKLLILLTFISLAIVGCNNEQTEKVVEDNTLIMTKKSTDSTTSDFYIKTEGGDETKLGNDLMTDENGYFESIYYLDGKNKCLYVDDNRNLQIISEDGSKEKIGSDVASSYNIANQENYYGNMESYFEIFAPSGFGISKDGQIVVYMNYEGDLYMKKFGDDKEKIASDVTAFEIDNVGKNIYYLKNGYDLYLYSNGENEKISSNVEKFRISDSGKIVTWLNSEYELYMRNLDSEDKEKLSSDTSELYSAIICNDGSVIYSSDGELYIYANGEKEKLASDIMRFCKNDKKIYYLNADGDLYGISANKGEKNKIHTDVIDIRIFDSSLYFIDEDRNLFKVQDDRDAEKLANDLMNVDYYNVVDGNLVYQKSDKSIYLNDKKVVSNSKGFAFNSVCFGYVDEKNQVHIYNFKDKKDSVEIKNAKKYSEIYLGNNFLYSNQLEPSDLEGYWKYEIDDPLDLAVEFKGEDKFIMYGTDDYKQEFTYTINYSEENLMYINIDGYEGVTDTIKVDETGKNMTIEEDGKYYYLERISKEEFEELLNTNKEILDSSEEISDSNSGQEDILSIAGTNESSILTDSSGKDYSAANVLDGDCSTTWAEGVDGSGIGEWIELDLGEINTITDIEIVNGLVNDNDGYYKNNRVKDVRFEFSDGTSQTATLDDDEKYAQTIHLSESVQTSYVRIVVESVYSGSEYDDTCISSVNLIGII